jgi:uncharacterized protein (DUF4415 family)
MKKAAAKRTRPKPPRDFEDNPAWSNADLARARPAREIVPAIVAAAKRGRPAHGDKPKIPVSLRLPPDVLQAYKATGKGWQGRMTEALAKGAKKLPRSGRAA